MEGREAGTAMDSDFLWGKRAGTTVDAELNVGVAGTALDLD
jgi:hypothetical protein